MISVEVVYVTPEKQQLLSLTVPNETTVETVIERSGILELFPEINLTQQKVGIFGQIVPLDHLILADDRIEIYRPLVCDPKEARRKRVKSTDIS